jgi:hypothetical protein
MSARRAYRLLMFLPAFADPMRHGRLSGLHPHPLPDLARWPSRISATRSTTCATRRRRGAVRAGEVMQYDRLAGVTFSAVGRNHAACTILPKPGRCDTGPADPLPGSVLPKPDHVPRREAPCPGG